MCHKTTLFYTVCAHSEKTPIAKCETCLSWKGKVPMVNNCAVTKQAQLVPGWCPKCDDAFLAIARKNKAVKRFNPERPEFISRYWGYKSQNGLLGPIDPSFFPKDLVEEREIEIGTLADGVRYEDRALRLEIEKYGADRIRVEEFENSSSDSKAEFPKIIDRALHLTMESAKLAPLYRESAADKKYLEKYTKRMQKVLEEEAAEQKALEQMALKPVTERFLLD